MSVVNDIKASVNECVCCQTVNSYNKKACLLLKHLTATVTQFANDTALCMFKTEYAALLCAAGWCDIKSKAFYPNYKELQHICTLL